MEDESEFSWFWVIIVIVFIVWGIARWGVWFQNDDQARMDCTNYNNNQTISDLRSCFANHHLDVTDTDIRKGCDQIAKDKYSNQTTTEPSENTLYISCVRGEGLPN